MKKYKKVLNLIKSPNFITMFRIAISPFIMMFCIFLPERVFGFRLFNAMLFCAIAITDFFDGYLARKNRQTSIFGSCFDNIADKILVVLTMLGLLVKEKVGILPVAIIITRDIVLSGMREFIAIEKNIKVQVTDLSKIKTGFQMVSIITLLLSKKDTVLFSIGTGLFLISASLSLITLYQHLEVIFKELKSSNKA